MISSEAILFLRFSIGSPFSNTAPAISFISSGNPPFGSYRLIPAYAKEFAMNTQISASIKHLDGIILKLTATAGEGKPLNPDMKIILRNVKATISGHYTKEL